MADENTQQQTTQAASTLPAELQQTLLEIKQAIKTPPRQQAAPPPAPSQGQQMTKEQAEKVFYADPVNASREIASSIAGQVLTDVQQNTIPTLAAMARSEVRREAQELFDRYASEIDEAMLQVHPAQRGNIENWRTAFNFVIGRHRNEIIEAEVTKRTSAAQTQKQIVPIDGPAAASTKAPPAPVVTPLSDEEREFTNKFKLSADQFRKGKDLYVNQSPLGPSAWDECFTFDNSNRKRSA